MTLNKCVVSVVQTLHEFAAMRGEWNALLKRSVAKSICLSWEWLHTWWEMYGDTGMQLYIIQIHIAGSLVGILPLCIQKTRHWGILQHRSLRFIGTGEAEPDAVVSEYLDVIVPPEYVERVVQAVCVHLTSEPTWDQMVFNELLDNALILTKLRACMSTRHFHSVVNNIGVRYAVVLPQTWEQYLSSLDIGAARRIRYKCSKLERAGRVTERLVVDKTELATAFKILAELHGARWNARGMPGVFISERFTTFHHRLAAQLLPLGRLSFRILLLDEKPIAALYNFHDSNVECYYQGGIDVLHAGRYSPGTVAHAYAIKNAIVHGVSRYDFMRGSAGSYKTEFGCTETPMYNLRLFSSTWAGSVLFFANLLSNKMRSIRSGITGR